MKFRLSTLLLTVSLVAMATGWLVDRHLTATRLQSIVERERVNARIDAAFDQVIRYRYFSPNEWQRLIADRGESNEMSDWLIRLDGEAKTGLSEKERVALRSFHDDRNSEIVDAIRLLWMTESVYDTMNSGEGVHSAQSKAKAFLSILNCHTPKSFRKFALTLHKFKTTAGQTADREQNRINVFYSILPPAPNEEYYPEFHDKQTNEYAGFDAFLAGALSRKE